MSFHPNKCEMLRVTNKRKPMIRNYTIHRKNLLTIKSIQSTQALTSAATCHRISILEQSMHSQALQLNMSLNHQDAVLHNHSTTDIEVCSIIWSNNRKTYNSKLETVQEMSRRKAKETMLIKITSQTYFLPREANLTIHGHDTRFLLP